MIELKRLGYSVKIEGSGESKSFIASDEQGQTAYTLSQGMPSKRDTPDSINIGIDGKGEGNRYTLSTFLLEEM